MPPVRSMRRRSIASRRRTAGAWRANLERLEERTLLSVALELSGTDLDTSSIDWKGQQRLVSAGRWIVAIDGLPADPAQELAAGDLAINRRVYAGPAVKTLRSLNSRSLLVETAPSASYDDVHASLATVPGFRYVEPDFIVSADSTTPNDPSFSSLYGMNNAGQSGGVQDADIDAPEAWDMTTGSGNIVVGVIDSGVDYNHPDLAANMWRNPGEIPGDGIDNDGNGFKDDVYGYDFINNDGDPFDDYIHGTHVAGTIAAAGNNGIGVAGVNWNAKIMALKFLGASGTGPISAAVSALNYATMMRNRGVNIRMTNNSWGGGAFSQAMSDAIAASGSAGMLFVAAAGNNASNNDTTPFYPAAYNSPNVIVVAATDSKDRLASFSNYGATSVDLAAPGVSILSTTPNNTYSYLSGTSMAAPHVTGVAALALSAKPNATYQEIRDAIYAGVDPIAGLAGKMATGGRLNARKTIERLLGDVGDTLAGARTTSLDAAGDHYATEDTPIGDGPSTSRDVDLYKITATPGSALTATTSQPSGTPAMDTVLRLFDAAGTPLAQHDDASGLYSRLDYTFTAGGTYYVGVSGGGNAAYDPTVAGSGAPGSTGRYRLDLNLDVGDTPAAAIVTGLAVGGRFSRPNSRIGDGPSGDRDVDLYAFNAPAGSTLTSVSLPASGGQSLETVLRLFDAAGNAVALADDPIHQYSRLTHTFTTEGTYYLGVSGGGNSAYDLNTLASGTPGSTGDYGLELSLDVLSPAEFELGSLLGGDGSKGFVVSGLGDYNELASPGLYQKLGDVNGDGIDDLMLGAPGDIGSTSMTLGHVYLIFGQPGGFPGEVDLRTLDGTAGYVIDGIGVGDRTGFTGGGAGDLNHDGIPDIAIGAISASPSSDRLKAGQSYAIFGGVSNLEALDLADGAVDGHIALARLDGRHGFAVNGIAADDNAGRVSAAGDLNHDGIDDLVIGAIGAGVAGAAYVIYGRDASLGQSFPAVFELATLNGTNGFTIPGLGTADNLGIAVRRAGDLNGDGIDDLVVGANIADPAGRVDAGQAYVIFGRPSFPATFSLATLNGSTGFLINGADAGDRLGAAVDGAGDVNGDGVDDLLVGAFTADVPGTLNAGITYLILGKRTVSAGPFPAVLEVSALNGSNGGAFVGVAANDNAGESVSWAGDVNADGFNDILIGSRGADPHGIISAGQSYVVYGGPIVAPRFELASLLADNGGDGSNGFAINGALANGQALRLNGIGDVNDDGIDDLRVSAPYVNLNGLTAPGQAYIIFGKASAPAFRVMPPSGLTTSEAAGGTARFSVVLSAQPAAIVTIPVSSTDSSEGIVSTSLLTFTPTDWNVPQTVTITGLNDGFADGDIPYTIVLGAATSADSTYDGLNPADVRVTNLDDDLVTATFTKTENKAIPDRGTYTSSLVVAPAGQILDLNVRVNINHNWDEDLDVTLIAPDGTRIELFTDVGGSGVNFTNTVLDDEATTLITAGAAPFSGTYKPEGNLTALEGKNLAGTWKLEATDDARLISGTLIDWAITARYATAAATPQAVVSPTSGLVTTESGGTASFTVRLDNAPSAIVTIPVSSSNTAEGQVSTPSLTFTPANWNVPQTVVVTGVDDAILDGPIAYSIILGATTSTDPDFNGLNPADVTVTNTDNDVPPTKFYVVNDGSPDRTYEYSSGGTPVENYATSAGNTAPRGAASTVAGDRIWVVDANKSVYVYNGSGGLLGSWTAGTLPGNAVVEGIATNGTDIWIVDAQSDKVYRYSGAAGRLSGTQTAASSFGLNSGNTSPKDIVADAANLWVVNDSSTDKVFKYSLTGSLAGSWTISGAGTAPTGITLDPVGGGTLWVVDSGTDRVYQFDNARSRTSGSQSPATSFALAAGNTNAQGIADPPVRLTPTITATPPAGPLALSALDRPRLSELLAVVAPWEDVGSLSGLVTVPSGPGALGSRLTTSRRRP